MSCNRYTAKVEEAIKFINLLFLKLHFEIYSNKLNDSNMTIGQRYDSRFHVPTPSNNIIEIVINIDKVNAQMKYRSNQLILSRFK